MKTFRKVACFLLAGPTFLLGLAVGMGAMMLVYTAFGIDPDQGGNAVSVIGGGVGFVAGIGLTVVMWRLIWPTTQSSAGLDSLPPPT